MLEIKLPNGDIGITFKHLHKPADPVKDIPAEISTFCTLYSLIGPARSPSPICQARAKLGKNDLFNKETGRKVALARALKGAAVDRAERELVWDAYFRRGDTTDPRKPQLPTSFKRYLKRQLERALRNDKAPHRPSPQADGAGEAA